MFQSCLRYGFQRLLFSFLMTSSVALAGEHFTDIQVGYLDGFYLRTADNSTALKVGARANMSYLYAFQDGQSDLSSFDLIHAKLYAGGHLISPQFQYYVQVAGGRHQRPRLLATPSEVGDDFMVLEDAYARILMGSWVLMAGQFKVPLSRQWMIYSGNLQFTDRSLASNFFQLGRDRGASLSYEGPVNFTAGIFNGGGLLATYGGTGQNTTNNTGHLIVARLGKDLLGPVGFSEGDVETLEGHRLHLGASFVYDFDRDVDLNGNGLNDEGDTSTWSVSSDLTWKHLGKSLQGEFYFRESEPSFGGTFRSYGFYVQPGVFIQPRRLEVAGRFGLLRPDTRAGTGYLYEAGSSLNYHWSLDHRIKSQLQYLWRAQELAGIRQDAHLIEFMLQFTL